MNLETIHDIAMEEIKLDETSVWHEYLEYALEQFALPFCYFCIKVIYTIFVHYSFFNTMVFLIKWIPMSVYLHKIINIYISSREKIKQQKLELKDIKLQIEIINTVKITLRSTEFAERRQFLKQKVEEFYQVRAKIKEIIATNEELRQVINNGQFKKEIFNSNSVPEEECELIVELLKELKYDHTSEIEKDNNCRSSADLVSFSNIGYAPANEAGDPACVKENICASANDINNKQDYNIKIAKVTIVYKVAYLRHYIKIRKRKSKLRKKLNNIQKLLKDWQKTLNMVINCNRLSMLNFDMEHTEIAPQEIGEISKANFHSLSDSESDFPNGADSYYDDYNITWMQNRPVYDYNNFTMDTTITRKCTDFDDPYNVYGNEERYGNEEKCPYNRAIGDLFMVPEETKSQVEIEKISSDN